MQGLHFGLRDCGQLPISPSFQVIRVKEFVSLPTPFMGFRVGFEPVIPKPLDGLLLPAGDPLRTGVFAVDNAGCHGHGLISRIIDTEVREFAQHLPCWRHIPTTAFLVEVEGSRSGRRDAKAQTSHLRIVIICPAGFWHGQRRQPIHGKTEMPQILVLLAHFHPFPIALTVFLCYQWLPRCYPGATPCGKVWVSPGSTSTVKIAFRSAIVYVGSI